MYKAPTITTDNEGCIGGLTCDDLLAWYAQNRPNPLAYTPATAVICPDYVRVDDHPVRGAYFRQGVNRLVSHKAYASLLRFWPALLAVSERTGARFWPVIFDDDEIKVFVTVGGFEILDAADIQVYNESGFFSQLTGPQSFKNDKTGNDLAAVIEEAIRASAAYQLQETRREQAQLRELVNRLFIEADLIPSTDLIDDLQLIVTHWRLSPDSRVVEALADSFREKSLQ